jgi:hypothetical protein
MSRPIPEQLDFERRELWKTAAAALAAGEQITLGPQQILDALSYAASEIDNRIIASGHCEALRADRDDYRRRADQTHAAYVGVDALLRASRERERVTQQHREDACQREAEASENLRSVAEQRDGWRAVAAQIAGRATSPLAFAVRDYEDARRHFETGELDAAGKMFALAEVARLRAAVFAMLPAAQADAQVEA